YQHCSEPALGQCDSHGQPGRAASDHDHLRTFAVFASHQNMSDLGLTALAHAKQTWEPHLRLAICQPRPMRYAEGNVKRNYRSAFRASATGCCRARIYFCPPESSRCAVRDTAFEPWLALYRLLPCPHGDTV